MSEKFDPYHLWLGIPAKDQPPTHYRLLGLELFETNTPVIDAAANRQITYLQAMASGEHRKEANDLLNEVAAARRSLLDADRRNKYDVKLKAKLNETVAVAEPVSDDAPSDKPKIDRPSKTAEAKSKTAEAKAKTADPKAAEQKSPSNKKTRKPAKPDDPDVAGSKPPVWKDWRILAGVGASLTLAIVCAVLFSGDAAAKPDDGLAQNSDTDTTNADTTNPEPVDAKTDLDKLLASVPKPDLLKDAKGSEDAAAIAAAVTSGAGLNPDLKLIQHWEFNGVSDVKSKVGLAKRQIELKGNPKFEVGPMAQSVVLDGIDDLVVIPPQSVSPAAGSFSAWIQSRDARKQTIPILDSDAASPYLLQLKPDMTLVATVGPGQTLTSSMKLKAGEWHHVAMSWRSGSEAKLYLDGEEVASKKDVPELKPAQALQLGAVGGDKPMFAAVAIDDVRFYRGILGASDISPLVAEAKRPKAIPQAELLASAGSVAAVPKPTPPKPKPTPPKPTPTPPPKPKPKAPKKNNPPKPQPAEFPLLVNLGGPKVLHDEREWLPAKRYQKGSWGYVGGTEKRGNTLSTSAVENLSAFKVDVPSGKYRIILYFADNWQDKPGQRQFTFKIGQAPPVPVDVVLFAGGKNRLIPSRPTEVPIRGGGTLEVTFTKVSGSPPILNAIRIDER